LIADRMQNYSKHAGFNTSFNIRYLDKFLIFEVSFNLQHLFKVSIPEFSTLEYFAKYIPTIFDQEKKLHVFQFNSMASINEAESQIYLD
jgi:hypothetical protein